MTDYLELAVFYLNPENNDLFLYYVGKAEAIELVLKDCFNWSDDCTDEHRKELWATVNAKLNTIFLEE